MNGHDNEIISIGRTADKDFFEGFNYDIEFSLHDSRIKNGRTCTDYDRIGSTYGMCVEENIRDFMLDRFGCLFPWFRESENTCKEIRVLGNSSVHEGILDLGNFVLGIKTNHIQPCRPPCQTVSIKLKRVDHWTRKDYAQLQFNILEEVTVHTDTPAYDMFNLVVDLGSALGLWLGLSAVSIFDSMVDFIRFTSNSQN